jgi:hypothetical protein
MHKGGWEGGDEGGIKRQKLGNKNALKPKIGGTLAIFSKSLDSP